MIKQIIIVDDDEINNMICSYVIKASRLDLLVQTFNIPEIGFEYLSKDFSKATHLQPTILLLDINMPSWTGWEFLEKYEYLDDEIKKHIKIFMLTSSLDTKDKENANKNKYVLDYIVKPLTIDIVKNIVIA